MNKKILWGATLLILGGVLGACTTNQEATNDSDKIQIMTTFYPMYEFTKNVVGEEGDVELLISAGTDSHDYEPSAKDLRKIQDADVFVYNNENMETWVPSIENVFEQGDVLVVKATENMVLLPGDEDEHDHSEEEEHGHSHALDPHVWLAPNLAMKEVEEIRDQLVKAYPDKADVLTANAEAYLEELAMLDESYQTLTDQAVQTSFVTQHAAFGYLATEYGLTQVPIAGLSADEEPSPARLAELKEYVKANDIQYIYFESNAKNAIAKTLAKEADVELLVLNTLEGLSAQEIEEGKNYVSVMQENLEALRKTTESTQASLGQETTVEKTVENGYFEDAEVEDRPLSNWAGEWQSVYPYLEDGTLDQVFEYKEKLTKDKTKAEYKAYYETGYQTDVDQITITDDRITFTDRSGNRVSSNYRYVGYKILTYEAGNRGVRYAFEATDPNSGAYRYVQFSDHTITDTPVEHYHIYFGNESQEQLYDEIDHWPTYYQADLTGLEIAQEMLAH